MQELFTLGVGDGYTERDVREHARALTGWTNSWNQATGQPDDFHFDPTLHDDGVKVIYGQRGNFGWRDSLRLVLAPPGHPRFFVDEALVLLLARAAAGAPTRAPPRRSTSPRGKQIRPLVEAMLMHPLVLRRPADGQAADRSDRRDAARHRPLHRHRRLGLGVEPDRADAVLPAERRRLGRHALAQHGHLAGALQPDRRDDRASSARSIPAKAKVKADPQATDTATRSRSGASRR